MLCFRLCQKLLLFSKLRCCVLGHNNHPQTSADRFQRSLGADTCNELSRYINTQANCHRSAPSDQRPDCENLSSRTRRRGPFKRTDSVNAEEYQKRLVYPTIRKPLDDGMSKQQDLAEAFVKTLDQASHSLDVLSTLLRAVGTHAKDVSRHLSVAVKQVMENSEQSLAVPKLQAPIQPETQPQTQPKAQAQPQPETQLNTQAQPEAETQLKTQAQPEAETQLKTQAQPEPETQLKTQAQPEAETQLKTQAQPETETQLKTLAQPEPETQLKTLAQPEPETQLKTQAQPEAETQLKTRTQPQPQKNVLSSPAAMGFRQTSQFYVEGSPTESDNSYPYRKSKK